MNASFGKRFLLRAAKAGSSCPSPLNWREANRTCIMSGMLMARFPVKRLIAALLPISFLWLFAACVSICVRESAEKHECASVIFSTEMKDASCCEGCPVSSLPQAAIPQRSTLVSDFQAPPAVTPLILAIDPLTDGIAFASRRGQLFSASPPLKDLFALRI